MILVPQLDVSVNDATLEEGKTYRYAVRYRLYNPLFDVAGQAVPHVANTTDVLSSPDPTAAGDTIESGQAR